jgi:putative inorganic carbon (HCO3(-)) transporter
MFPSIGTLGAVVLGGALGVASVGIAFAMGMRRAVLAIFLVRSSCDPVFGLTQAGGMGVGAAVNVLVIVLALLFFLESPILIGSAILPWAGFLMTALASVIGSPEPMMKALRGFFVLTSYAAVFALPLALIRSRQWALRCLTVVMCSSIIPVTYAFVEIASGAAEGDRLRSTFGHPNIFAYYLVSLLALTLFLLRSSLAPISPRVRLWLVLYLPIIIVLLLLTESRGAWVSGAIVLIGYASIIDKRYLLCLLLVPVVIHIPIVEERLSDLQTGNLDYGYAQLNSYAWRKLLWQSALDWLMDNPSTSLLLGYGWGSFEYYSPIFFPRAAPDGMVAHNAILQTFFEMGILGLLAFLWVFVALFAKLKIGYSFDKAGATIMMTLELSYLVASYADNMFAYLAFQWYFWFIMGVVCAWYKLRSTPQPVDMSMVQGLISAQSAERRTA